MAVAMKVNKRLFVGHQGAPAKAVGFSSRGGPDFKGSQTGWLSHEMASIVTAARLVAGHDDERLTPLKSTPQVVRKQRLGTICNLLYLDAPPRVEVAVCPDLAQTYLTIKIRPT